MEENSNIKKHRRFKFLISYYIIFLFVLAISTTMARYTNNINLVSKINVAQFNLTVEDDSSPQNMIQKSRSNDINNKVVNLNDTVIDDGYGGKLIIPGSKGVITLNLNFTNVETAVDYDIVVNTENLPNNLKFYADEDYTININNFKGIAKLNDKIISHRIYWVWQFNDEDEGTYINSNMNAKISVHIVQKVGKD